LYLTVSHAVARLFGLAAVTILTRYLGPGEYGNLTLAYAYQGLFAALVEASLDLTLIREASKNPDKLGHYIGNGIMLRGIFAVGGYLLAKAVLPFLGYDPAEERFLGLAVSIILLSPFAVTRLIFLVTLEIKLVAILDAIAQLLSTISMLSVVLFQYGKGEQILVMQVAATAAAQCLYFAYGRRSLSQPISFRLDWRLWGTLLNQTWPLTVLGMVHTLQAQIARMLIGSTMGSTDGGLYTLAFNLSKTLDFVSVAYCSSIYPLLSRYYTTDPERFRRLYQFSFRLMMTAILPIALLASLTSGEIVTLYAGSAYLQAAPVLAVMIWAQAFQFTGLVLYHTALAAGQQRLLPRISIVTSLSRIGLQILLVQRIGLLGAACALLAMYGVSFAMYGLAKPTRAYALEWLRSTLAPGIAVLIVGVLLIIAQPPVIITWAGGLALYGLLSLLLRSVKLGDVHSIRQLLWP
jgi:O-antigen/teichoic acid export membrane protein